MGVALYEVEELACKGLRRFIVSLQGYEMQKVKEKVAV